MLMSISILIWVFVGMGWALGFDRVELNLREVYQKERNGTGLNGLIDSILMRIDGGCADVFFWA